MRLANPVRRRRIGAEHGSEPGIKQRAEGGGTNACGGAPKELSAGDEELLFGKGVHAVNQFFVTVSSRFKITLATVVQAARSAAATPLTAL